MRLQAYERSLWNGTDGNIIPQPQLNKIKFPNKWTQLLLNRTTNAKSSKNIYIIKEWDLGFEVGIPANPFCV